MLVIASAILSFLMAAALTGLVRRYALARRVLDVPNERSSHKTPTARGGGVAIVIAYVLATALLVVNGALAWTAALTVLGPGLLVAVVGFVDDHGHISPIWRICVHFIAAVGVLVMVGGPPPLIFRGHAVDLGAAGAVLAVLYLVWLLNLFNFMDGIDGIAGLEAVTVLVCGAALSWGATPGPSIWILATPLAAAAAGFLLWNFPPARIFMGDAGSYFLGLAIGALSLLATRADPLLFWCWVILLGVFVVDATVTLIRRVSRGERFYEAHRSHAYQHAALELGGHKGVTLCVGAINLLWLMPIALCVRFGYLNGPLGVVIAYGPLVGLARRFHAGEARRPVA